MPQATQPAKRKVGHHDVELAKVERKYEVWRIVAYGAVGVFWIAACAVPLLVMQGVIQPLAGKTTTVDANVVISLSLTISVAVNAALAWKVRSQRADLRRQRAIISELETGDTTDSS